MNLKRFVHAHDRVQTGVKLLTGDSASWPIPFIFLAMSIKNLMQQLNQRPIAVYPAYIDITGSVNAGLLLSQLMYWYSVVNRKFYKTDEDIMAETRLSIRELKTAKAKLKTLPFIFIKAEGVPARTFYDIDMIALAECLANTPNKFVQNVPTEKVKTSKLKSTKRTNLKGQNVPTITETTPEITSKNISYTFSENEFSEGEIGEVAKEFETYGEPSPLIQKEKKKAPPISASTPPRPATLEHQMLETYAAFMEQKGIPVSRSKSGHVQFDKRAYKSMKDWAAWAEGMPNATDTLTDWQQFLEAAWATGDKWLLVNFEPNILYSKRTNIVTAIGAKQAKAAEALKSDGFIEKLLGW